MKALNSFLIIYLIACTRLCSNQKQTKRARTALTTVPIASSSAYNTTLVEGKPDLVSFLSFPFESWKITNMNWSIWDHKCNRYQRRNRKKCLMRATKYISTKKNQAVESYFHFIFDRQQSVTSQPICSRKSRGRLAHLCSTYSSSFTCSSP